MRKLVPALVTAAVAVVGIGTPAAAADVTGPAIQWAQSVNDDLGRIQVSASADAGVTGITAHIVVPGTGAEVAAVTSFHLSSGTDEAGVWQSDEVLLPDLGFYTLNVEVTDAAGAHTEADGIGTFVYAVTMYFDSLKTTPTLTYTQRDYTASGKLMGRWPGTRATAPVAGEPIQALIPGGGFTDVVRTGAKGQFSVSGPVSFITDSGGFLTTVDDPEHVAYLQGFSNLVAAKIKPAATKVTVHLDRAAAVTGDPITVSGDATWKSPDGWAPLANTSVGIAQCPRGDHDPNHCFPNGPTVSTDASGHYTAVLTASDTDLIEAVVSSEDPFVQTVTYGSQKIKVLIRTSFDGFFAGRDTGTGQVIVGAQGLDLSGSSADDAVVTVQFSPNGVTGWRKVGTIDLGAFPSTNFNQFYDHPGAGYWRMTYAGEKDRLAPVQTEAVYVA